jgi:hypothetical protein
MSNDAEAREVHATIADREEAGKPVNGYQDEPVSDDRGEPVDRTDLTDEDDEDDELVDPDAIIIAEDSGDADDDADDMDEAEGDTHPDTVVASAIVVEPVSTDDTVAEPVSADAMAEPIPADGTMADPGPESSPAGPKHAADDSGPVRPGMPVNGDVPKGGPMVGDPEQLHERWAAIQSTFVDDPRGSVTSAAEMVTEVIATVVASAQERESALRGEWDRDGADTESLRNALRSYRALLDQLAAL